MSVVGLRVLEYLWYRGSADVGHRHKGVRTLLV